MTEQYVIKSAEIPRIGDHDDFETVLVEAPFDGLIANALYVPAENIQGAYYTRQLNLSVHRDGKIHHAVSTIQLNSNDVLLPAVERHRADLLMPPISMRICKGDSLVWSSIGSVGEGLEVPDSRIEITFERKSIFEDASLPDLWRQCVPEYWLGKDVRVTHHDRDIVSPRHAFTSTAFESTGTFLGADTSGIRLWARREDIEGPAKETLLFFNRLERLRLLTNA